MYRSKFASKDIDSLFEGILALKTVDECYRFFEDICTINEIKSLAMRLDVALKLTQGETYQEITESTKASTATISRINRCINYGADGYKIVLNRLNAKNKDKSND